MNKNQVKGPATGAKGKVKAVAGKGTADKSTHNRGKGEKQGGHHETVLAKINDDPKKATT